MNGHSSRRDFVVVVPLAEIRTAHLRHEQPAPRAPVSRKKALEQDVGAHQALRLKIVEVGVPVVEQQHGDSSVLEEVLHRQELAAVPERIPGEQS